MKNNDLLQRFLFTDQDVRGAVVSAQHSIDEILEQQVYPAAVASLLSKLILANTLMRASIKQAGTLIVQIQNEGPIELLVTKCDEQSHVVATAKWDKDKLSDDLEQTLNQGKMVVTFLPKQGEPQQSIVPLNGISIKSALEAYFMQSEQLPTKFWFEPGERSHRALLLQLLPQSNAKVQNDFNLQTAMLRSDCLQDKQQLDHAELLQQLFPEQTIECFDPEPVTFQCSCSRERMKKAIRTMGESDALFIISQKQSIEVNCDFCHNKTSFSRDDVQQIFAEEKAP